MDTAMLVYYLQEGIEIVEASISQSHMFPGHKKRCRNYIQGAKELIDELTGVNE
jgi:hypothetical protein